jgi:hypothetical protein
MSLAKTLQELEDLIPHAAKSAPAVSKRGVDWHLDHSLKIIASISTVLKKSNPADFKPRFSFWKWVILGTGYIPKGRSRSPKPFNQLESIDPASLLPLLEKAKLATQDLEKLPKNAYFEHPFFGHIAQKDAIKFINIHSWHHIKIAKEIVAKAS